MVELCADQLSVVASDGAVLVAPTDLSLSGGALIALVGPNGAGKSSLVRALAGITPHAGSATLDGADVGGMSPISRARRIAWLPQALPPAWPVSVHDAVALGRFAYGAAPGHLAAEDAEAVLRSLRTCDVMALADRRITTLSGGELARVHLARALAADADVLLADEPTAALDLAHQWALMQVLHAEAARGRIVLVVVHDIGLAARWANRIIVMDGGRVVDDGCPCDVITPYMLANVFGVIADVCLHDGRPVVRITGNVSAAAARVAD